MNKIKSVAFICILFMFSQGLAFPQSGDADSIIENNQDYVISLSLLDADGAEIGIGTGFFIGEGILVTNYHLVSKALDAQGINFKGKKVKIEGLLAVDKNLDIAIIKTKGKSKYLTPGDSDELASGRKIFVMGSDTDGSLRADGGTVESALELSPSRIFYNVTIETPDHFSGGPVFNQSGQALGVMTFIDLRTKVIIPINYIKSLPQSGTPTPMSESTPEEFFETFDGADFAGRLFLALDNSYQAEIYLKKVAKFKPDDIEIHELLAELYMAQRNYSSAESTFSTIIELDQNRDSAHFGLGMIRSRMLKWKESIAPLQKALELNDKNIQALFLIGNAYFELRDFAEAANFYNQYIALNPPDVSEAYKQLGISLFESEQFAEAAPAFQEALKAVPGDITLNYKLAQSFQNSGQYEQAEKIFLMMTELSPENLAAYHNTIVRMYDEAKMPDKAVEAATRLVELDPNNAEGQFNLGYMLIKQENFAAAADVFKKVIEINPSMEYAYLQLGYCYTQLKQHQNATDVYKQLVEIVPENADAWMGIGIGYMQQKKWSPAVEPLQKVIELAPENGNAYYNLGICYLNLKDNFSAREIWEQLRKINQSLANKLYEYIR